MEKLWEFFKTSFLVVKAYFPKLDKISCEGRLTHWQSLKVKWLARGIKLTKNDVLKILLLLTYSSIIPLPCQELTSVWATHKNFILTSFLIVFHQTIFHIYVSFQYWFCKKELFQLFIKWCFTILKFGDNF